MRVDQVRSVNELKQKNAKLKRLVAAPAFLKSG